ncbi:MAG: Cell surface protein, partial [Candidatus Magasanikbacteria bacterium GW2011_GWC2_45_8]
WGTATPGWTILNYYNYLPAQWKHYKIPIGTHYTGLTDSIFFINRGPATTNSAFKNIRIYENTQDAFTYAWDVDNDGTTDATTKNFFYTYSSAGTYTATLKVSDGMSTVTKQMTVTVQ